MEPESRPRLRHLPCHEGAALTGAGCGPGGGGKIAEVSDAHPRQAGAGPERAGGRRSSPPRPGTPSEIAEREPARAGRPARGWRALPAVAALAAAGCAPGSPATVYPAPVTPGWAAGSVAQWVDPFIGTHGDGNTFPGATVPWGMVAPSPHTRRPSAADYLNGLPIPAGGYVDDDAEIHGFGLTHLSGVGCPDLGAPVVAASAADIATTYDAYGAARENERAWPGYYSVDLIEPGVRVELTASPRVAALRFSAGRGGLSVMIDAAYSLSWLPPSGQVHLVSNREVEGQVETGQFCFQSNRQTVYFVARFARPAAAFGTWQDGVPGTAADATGAVGAWFRFDVGADPSLEMQVGVSYVSVAGARANLDAEGGSNSFDELRLAAQASWNAALARIQVEGGAEADRVTFYTALYHSLLHPSLASDVDGSYRRFGGGTGSDPSHPRYHVFSMWDTWRGVHPLLTLLYPERQAEMLRSLLRMTLEAGVPPKWELCGSEVQMMVGDPADIVLADAVARIGPLPSDLASLARQAWPLVEAAALDTTSSPPHRPGNASYRSLGYVPIEEGVTVWGPVSTTLEYALDDYALASLGSSLGVEVDPSLPAQSSSWTTLVDPSTELFRPRHQDGTWYAPFDPDALEGSAPLRRDAGGPGFVEGTAWQYAFYAPHAVLAQAAATGGPSAYVARLQGLFASGRFATWNEPDMAFPYIFTLFPGEGWRTAAAVRDARWAFDAGHGGLPGNDDAGAMSAWFVFSALGFFPDVPASGDYALGTPLFERATLALPGASFVIEAPHPTPARVFVRRARIGTRQIGQRLAQSDLLAGGTLRIELSETP